MELLTQKIGHSQRRPRNPRRIASKIPDTAPRRPAANALIDDRVHAISIAIK
jgi:hypothetical protein